MTSVANLQPEPAPIRACTISRDVQNFDLLIDDMENELGEAWGDLSFEDAQVFLQQPEAQGLEFVTIAVNGQDEQEIGRITEIIQAAKEREVKVVLVADQVSPITLHKLLRLGADDFLPYPLPEGGLHETMEKLRRMPAMPSGPRLAPVGDAAHDAHDTNTAHPGFKAKGDRDAVILPVHGLSGGSGASTFAANLAWELATIAKEGPRVCLIDFDFQFGSAATYLDLPRKEAILDILQDTEHMDSDTLIQAMLTFNDKLHVFTAPADMLPLDIVTGDDIGRIVDNAASNFDFVIIDMPRTVVSWTETVINRAHVYFAMMELDLRSAQNALRLVRALKSEGLPAEKLRYILNRAPRFSDLSAKSRVKRMAESLDISLEVQLPDGGAQVTQANDHGLPISEVAAKNPLRKEIQKLAKSLHELNVQVEAGRR